MKVGVQFYSFIPLIKEGKFDEALSLASRCGVDGVELFSYYDIPAIKYRKAFNDAGIVCYGSHNHLSPLLNDLDHVMEYNYIVGNPTIICHYLMEDERGDLDKYLYAAESFNKIASVLKTNGFNFVYHNHDFEFRDVFDGKYALDVILENTDPNLVGMELHIGQLPVFNIDILEYMKRIGRRIKMLHVHCADRDGQPFDSGPAIAYGRELNVEWAVLEDVYPADAEPERVKKDINSIRLMALGN
ncbi:MAG: sugar phosphate isomerase/epimerase [Clostridiales bacterium]|jgi:sugar phosphate isomerase/epimerase|nr:sugar phosphate isomerase/epimerase [Clostridiales bacterium]